MASYSKAVTGTAVMARSANEEKKKSTGVNSDAIMGKLNGVWLSEKGSEGVKVYPVLTNVKHAMTEST